MLAAITVTATLGAALPAGGGPTMQALPTATDAPDRVEEGLLDEMTEGPRGVIVHFDSPAPTDLGDLPVREVRYVFEHLPAAYVVAGADGVRALAEMPSVAFVEDAWKPIAFHLDTATVASRAREVYEPGFESPLIDEPSPPLEDGQGRTIDGRDVGIAVVDSGFDGTHPDFTAPGKQGGNYVVTPHGVQQAGSYTVIASGHGTYVAGSAAGDGTASEGRYQGAAPGGTLYTFATWRSGAIGQVDASTVHPAIAFDWILSHGDAQDPPIRIVANAWSCTDPACNAPDGPMAHRVLAEELADQGDVVLFSVGNNGGDGLVNRVSPEARLPTPGIVGVGTHDDEEVGGRSDCTKSFSSRGDAFDPSTWPDVIAPGDDVTTPQAIVPSRDTRVPVPGGDDRHAYTTISGTSASTGHAAGVAALVLQADPGLSPGEVEHILEVTAHKLPPAHPGDSCPISYVRADPSNPFSTANYAAGHGLVDAMDAVELALNWSGIPDEEPALEPIPGNITREGPVVSLTDGALYLSGEDGLSEDPPEDARPRIRVVDDGETASYTSAPFDQARNLSGAYVEAWVGSDMELAFTRCAGLDIFAGVARVDGTTDEATTAGVGEVALDYVTPGGPWLKEIPVPFDEEVRFDAGDRLQLSLSTERCGGTVSQFAPSPLVVYSDAKDTPSRVLFGETTDEIRSGTFEACQALDAEAELFRAGCSWIGGPRRNVPLHCEERMMVSWFGPPGSTAIAHCNGAEAVCTVPGEEGNPWASCTAESEVPEPILGYMEMCTYVTPDGAQVDGEGFCAQAPGPVIEPPGIEPS